MSSISILCWAQWVRSLNTKPPAELEPGSKWVIICLDKLSVRRKGKCIHSAIHWFSAPANSCLRYKCVDIYCSGCDCIKVHILPGLTNGDFSSKKWFQIGFVTQNRWWTHAAASFNVHIPFYDYSSVIKEPFIHLGEYFLLQEKPKWGRSQRKPSYQISSLILCRKYGKICCSEAFCCCCLNKTKQVKSKTIWEMDKNIPSQDILFSF